MLAIGSPNVLTNARAAMRAMLSSAGACNGLPFDHPPLPVAITVQQGSASVLVNRMPASRPKDKLMCGAHIKSGSPNVVIGGETKTVGFIFDLEAWTRTGLEVLGLAALFGGALYAAAAGFAAFATFAGTGLLAYARLEGVDRIGDALGPGHHDLLQGIAGMGLVIAGPKLARQSAKPVAPKGPTPSQQAQAWKGKGAYPGVDQYRDITLKKGTVIYAGDSGQSSYYMPASAVRRANGSRSTLFQGLQVQPHSTFGYRPAVRAYEVTQDTPAAFGVTRANPQHGAGGLPQYSCPITRR